VENDNSDGEADRVSDMFKGKLAAAKDKLETADEHNNDDWVTAGAGTTDRKE
jgi:hypothetical protein